MSKTKVKTPTDKTVKLEDLTGTSGSIGERGEEGVNGHTESPELQIERLQTQLKIAESKLSVDDIVEQFSILLLHKMKEKGVTQHDRVIANNGAGLSMSFKLVSIKKPQNESN